MPAKSLTGGIQMGAVMCNDRIKVPVKHHTSSFGGNPTACAAALAMLVITREEIDAVVAALNDALGD